MKALLWHNQRDVRVEEVPEPTVKPEQLRLKLNGVVSAGQTCMNI